MAGQDEALAILAGRPAHGGTGLWDARVARGDLANALLALLPLFQSLRAAIAAKTRGFAAAAQSDPARASAVRFDGLWLDCPEHIRVERTGARSGDASDAGADVARRQSTLDLGALEWRRLDAGGERDAVFAAARAALRHGSM